MKSKLIIGAIFVVGIVAGLMSYFVFAKPAQQATDSKNKNASEEEMVENGNIFTLVDMGHAHQCTFTYSGSTGNSEGKMYTDGKGRGLMTVDVKTAKGNTGQVNTLLLNDKVYGWTETDGKTVGFVYSKSTITSGKGSSASSSGVDPNQKFELKCSSWNVDEAKLSVPSNVNFMSMPNM